MIILLIGLLKTFLEFYWLFKIKIQNENKKRIKNWRIIGIKDINTEAIMVKEEPE